MHSSSFLLKLLFILVLYAMAYAAIFLNQLGVPTLTSGYAYEITKLKQHYALSAKEKKILLVAGSNVLYGLKARIIEQETGIRTINMGVRVANGLQYIFDQVRLLAKPGDIIIMPLEYALYLEESIIPPFPTADYILSRDPDYFFDMNLKDQILYAVALSPTDIFSRFSKHFYPDEKLAALNWDLLITLDEYGDETRNTRSAKNLAGRMRAINGSVSSPFSIATVNTARANEIKEFALWCKAHHVRLFATYPNILFQPQFNQPGAQNFFRSIALMYEQLDVPVLGKPHDFMYPKGDFFDSIYHPYADIAEKHSRQLLEILRAEYPDVAN